MVWVNFGARHGLRCCLLAAAAIATALTITSDAAVARRHHRIYVHYVHAGHGHRHHHARAEAYDPPFASIVVDGNSGTVLQASNPDALRHPASLTKVMTLYLLFERLDVGKIKLETPLKVSEHASDQAPTKLDLRPGQTITVEDAIKAVVTKSANDAAVAIAEELGGSEEAFAKTMTQKAHALGMTRTTYINASGLPDDDQITTARDQALLGRAIQDRFPRYYKYFSTQTFQFRGATIRGHDHLLSEVAGVDGIKTGFTRASGFNLLTSLHRDGRYLVAVVLGGPTASERDARMRELIAEHIREASLHRTAPLLADAAETREEPRPVAFAKAPMAAHTDAAPTPMVAAHAAAGAAGAANDPIKPLVVRTISYRTAPVQSASLAPMPMMVPVAAAAPQALPVQASARAAAPVVVAAAAEHETVAATATPAPPVERAAPPAQAAMPEPVKTATAATDEDTEPASVERSRLVAANIPSAPVHARGGWLIQIGAFDDENDAKQHLSDAQTKAHAALAAKDPFTERIQKGDKSLYRARFAGFDRATAEAACRQLKRSDFECMALKD